MTATLGPARRRPQFTISPTLFLLGLTILFLVGAFLALSSALAVHRGIVLEDAFYLQRWFGRKTIFHVGVLWMGIAFVSLVPAALGRARRQRHRSLQRLLVRGASGVWNADTVVDRFIGDAFQKWAAGFRSRAHGNVLVGSGTLAASLAALAIATWIAWVMHVNPPNHNYSDTFPVALWRLGEFDLIRGSIHELAFPNALSWLPTLLAFGSRTLAIDLGSLHVAVTAVSVGLGLAGISWAARLLGGSHWAGLAAALVLPGTWLATWVVGYLMSFWDGIGFVGYWGLGWSLLAWALWLGIRSQRWAGLIPFALAGLIFNFHSIFGVILLGAFFLGEVLELVERGSTRAGHVLRRTPVKVLAFALFALPQLFMLFARGHAVRDASSSENWWKLMLFRKSHHVFVWDGSWAPLQLLILLSVFFLLLALAGRRIQAYQRARLTASAGATVFFCGVSFVSLKVFPNPTLASLVLTRSMFLLVASCIVMACALPFLYKWRGMSASGQESPTVLLSVCAVPAVFGLGQGAEWMAPVVVLLLAGCLLHKLAGRGTILLYAAGLVIISQSTALFSPILVVVTGGLLWAVAAFLPTIERPASGLYGSGGARLFCTGLAAVCFLVISVSWLQKLYFSRRLPPASSPEWVRMVTWIREESPRDALFLVPPYPYATSSAQRSHIIDWNYMGASVYHSNLLDFELRALRTVYGIDLAAMSREQVERVKLTRSYCPLENGYRDLLSDINRVREVMRVYPRLAFLVGFKPRITPPGWECGSFAGPLLRLPIAYENHDYVVYDLRQRDVAASASGMTADTR